MCTFGRKKQPVWGEKSRPKDLFFKLGRKDSDQREEPVTFGRSFSVLSSRKSISFSDQNGEGFSFGRIIRQKDERKHRPYSKGLSFWSELTVTLFFLRCCWLPFPILCSQPKGCAALTARGSMHWRSGFTVGLAGSRCLWQVKRNCRAGRNTERGEALQASQATMFLTGQDHTRLRKRPAPFAFLRGWPQQAKTAPSGARCQPRSLRQIPVCKGSRSVRKTEVGGLRSY